MPPSKRTSGNWGPKDKNLIFLVFLWGGMNSWFLYEFTVFLMGSISANIAGNLGKLIMPCQSWCWGAAYLFPVHECYGALVSNLARIKAGA